MKTAADIRYFPPISFSLRSGEKIFSDRSVYAVPAKKDAVKRSSLHAGTALKFFIISSARAMILVLITLIKTMNAMVTLLDLFFRSALSGLEKY